MGQLSESAGITVEHDLDYQLQPPSDQKDFYSAKIVVKTKTQNRISPSRLRPDEKSRSENFKSSSGLESIGIGNSPSILESKGGPKSISKGAVLGGKDSANRGLNSPAKRQSLMEERIFELAYLEEQWRLVTEVDSDPERLWFQYALEH